MSSQTRLGLEAALQRILDGKAIRLPVGTKLSIRAVETEAKLGDGSAHYYKDIIAKIKAAKLRLEKPLGDDSPRDGLKKVRQLIKGERRIKESYRSQVEQLKADQRQMAAQHHQLSDALRNEQRRAATLERDVVRLKEELADARRSQVVSIAGSAAPRKR